ncbi:hypothetical protein M752DRAFT_109768 [Aspergillus phoenicis ATCC 13157]|uniref:Uncharacterized protein n=1 Tax=Aspergillus phoenicis ATCC 13157 TaxID=1353007 RepID=A0A370P4I6_ASPPH|nr:hypothetical protein M752DRAFT_109768 [Aspergillus phoenicis ATCC 13157]
MSSAAPLPSFSLSPLPSLSPHSHHPFGIGEIFILSVLPRSRGATWQKSRPCTRRGAARVNRGTLTLTHTHTHHSFP